MLFCPKCGSILSPKEEGNKTMLVCFCGYSSNEKEDILIREEVKNVSKLEIADVDVKTMPKVKDECPKCKNKGAYFWTVQTRAGDEAETRFFECIKCKYRWREYS